MLNNVMLNLIQHLKRFRVKPGMTLILSILIFFIDRLSKLYFPGPKLYNTGAAFGILEDHTWFLTVFSAVVLVSLAIYVVKSGKSLSQAQKLGLAMIMGGTAGNLFDRVLCGYVIDFIALGFIDFPVFNLADVSINIGAAVLIAALLVRK